MTRISIWGGSLTPMSLGQRSIMQDSARMQFENVQDLAVHFAKALQSGFNADAVSMWSHDPVGARLIHIASEGLEEHNLEPIVIRTRNAYSGVAVERKRISKVEVGTARSDGKSDVHQRVTAEKGFRWLVSVPVLNLANANQVLYLINFQYRSVPTASTQSFMQAARVFAESYESVLHELCFRQSNILQLDAAASAVDGGLDDLSRTLANHIERTVDADAVGVYVLAKGTVKLIGYSKAGIRSLSHSQAEAVAVAEKAATMNREQIHHGLERPTDSRLGSVLGVPIRDGSGEAIGAIACIRESKTFPFNYDDITLTEALVQVFAPYHEMMFSEEQRLQALSRLGHELKGPVTGLRSAMELAEHRLLSGSSDVDRCFKDLGGYTNSIANLADDFELGTDMELNEKLELEHLSLVHDLFAPSMRAVEGTLEKRGYAKGKITRPLLHSAPKMWLDRGRMLQVVFNLLENAIKYSGPDPGNFDVKIRLSRTDFGYAISVRDHGIGIPPGFERRIFLLGIRAPNALEWQAQGKGIGLAIARNVVRAHNGDLRYRRHENGSEFIIELPYSVVDEPQSKSVL